MKKVLLLIAAMLLVTANIVLAAPQITAEPKGSSFVIYANNPENVAYSCSANYVLGHSEPPYADVFYKNFYVGAHVNGAVSVDQLSWSADYITKKNFQSSCSALPTSYRPQPVDKPACPGDLSYIGIAAIETNRHSRLEMGTVNFPPNFRLDPSYHQTETVVTKGGGAGSRWNGRDDIPGGVHLESFGNYYWSIGEPIPWIPNEQGRPRVIPNSDGTARLFAVSLYCGAGPHGIGLNSGCTAGIKVCAKRLP